MKNNAQFSASKDSVLSFGCKKRSCIDISRYNLLNIKPFQREKILPKKNGSVMNFIISKLSHLNLTMMFVIVTNPVSYNTFKFLGNIPYLDSKSVSVHNTSLICF